MEVISDPSQMLAWSRQKHHEGMRVGLVPTMGSLHEGHLSLIRKATDVSDVRVVSIFVNPTQFGPGEDFEKYPRDMDGDMAACRSVNGVDIVFVPSVGAMYDVEHSVFVDEERLSLGLCGLSRPGHFRGVLTIVLKLFNMVYPDVAVFGQKDAQQARLIERMVKDLNVPVKVEVAPIVREHDGLAMSSRNKYLDESARQRATVLHESLCMAEDLYAKGERDVARIKSSMLSLIEDRCVDGQDVIDYVDIVDYRSLQSSTHIEQACLVAVAVKINGTRLIDNVILGRDRSDS